ncbi:hypothetical protein D1B31_20525 [Neobacillus notoginsengisoli]|uniref:Flagellar protein n=1 Tax=Neobacillus notoginsengisoli TaxID=1578198 RepID=A0A417YJF9_9BACI|nr:flagellar biosynthetic protein FliO [Neobacillus notoginsengisoli]RHW33303.1 hypothetical protein D1B31_20525 [Neobacillus notoginsengisoli]
MSCRNIIILLASSLILLLVPLTVTAASESNVYEKYEKNTEHENNETVEINKPGSTSILPYALKFISSFLLIIALLYFVLKFLSKRGNLAGRGGAFHGIGGHPLGNNRSVQLLMIGDTLYILGVGASIQLIRMIPPGEEQSRLLESAAIKPDEAVLDWGSKLKQTSYEKWKELLVKQLKEGNPRSGQENEHK